MHVEVPLSQNTVPQDPTPNTVSSIPSSHPNTRETSSSTSSCHSPEPHSPTVIDIRPATAYFEILARASLTVVFQEEQLSIELVQIRFHRRERGCGEGVRRGSALLTRYRLLSYTHGRRRGVLERGT